jgi:hypothetical protein
MIKSIPALLIFAILAMLPAWSQESTSSHVVALKPFPRDHRFAIVSGDPTKPGALYVIRIHSEAGYIIMPHAHPEDEHITVLKGTWELGMGDRFNPNALESMEMGGYGLVGKKMAHFGFSKTDAVVQVHGIGLFTTTWITPNYELTDQGVLLSTSANLPGRPTSTVPPGCFDLKLGTRARAALGEGVIIGAQCTPEQLTQYRIEKAGGEIFWAQRQELTTP